MPCATLDQLPPPPPGKTGWPWTVETPTRKAIGPQITIVTPSYNQSAFLEETIRSVLLQGYANVQYIVIDGGSPDNSVDTIRKYAPFIDYWTSENDAGQADAINRGFRRATGQWIAWQNSDDFYQPGAFHALIDANSTASVVYGSLKLIDADSRITADAPTSAFDPHRMFPWANMFNQSMFFHRRIFEAAHFIDESLHHYIDHDFFWRLILAGFEFQYVPQIQACFRIHEAAKGATQQELAASELHALYKRVYNATQLPQSVRDKALQSMRSLCVDQFGKSRWSLFQRFSAELRKLAGLRGLGASLIFRRFATFMGTGNIDRIRRLKRTLLHRG